MKKRDAATHLWLVTAERSVRVRETLEPDRELDVGGSDDVLDLELGELGVKPKLLDDSRVSVTKKQVHERSSDQRTFAYASNSTTDGRWAGVGLTFSTRASSRPLTLPR